MSDSPYTFSPDDDTSSPSDAPAPACQKPLHPLSGVVVATMLGSMIAGAIVIAISLRRLGRSAAAWWTVVVAVLVTVPMMAGFYFLPDINVPNSAYTMPQLIGMYYIGRHLYGKELEHQTKAGGPIASAWRGAGIGLVCCITLIVCVFGVVLVAEGESLMSLLDDYGETVEFGDDTVYFDGDATADEAQELGRCLTEQDYFEGNGVDARIRREDGHCYVSFVVADDAWNTESVVDYFQAMGEYLVAIGFEPPLSIEICDDMFESQKTLRID